MSYIINSLKLNNERYKHGVNVSKIEYLDKLSKINIFIGSNNSGKSQMLRDIFKTYPLEFLSHDVDLKQLLVLQNELIKRIESFMEEHHINDYEDVRNELNSLPDLVSLEEDIDVLDRINSLLQN